MISQLKTIFAAATLFAALPALASAHSVTYGTAPVSVTSCAVTASTNWDSLDRPYSFGAERARSNDDIALGYVNTSSVAATSIEFAVNDGERTHTVRANGTFAPGIAIARSFTTDGGAAVAKNAICTVAEVRFADGGVWHAGMNVAARR